nr:zf-CCHC domain-containing protein/DUF4219 domain-containing protein/UBN2 domain-containing protein [Tanacetum cinerariifolium]
MDSDKYLKGKSMHRPPLFESDCFIYSKNRFETYVKAKDLDLWHIILNGDFPPVAQNKDAKVLEVVPFEEQSDDLKKNLAKNNKAKMVLYNASSKKEYERVFMCKTAKDIWQSLLITHQYSEIYRGKKEKVKSIALKAEKESSDDETSTSESDDEEYAMVVRIFKRDEKKGKTDQKCFRFGDPNHLIDDCPKPPRNKDQKAFIRGSWSDSENDADDKINDETCLMAQSSNEGKSSQIHASKCFYKSTNDTFDIILVHAGNPTSFDWMMGRVLDPTAQRLKVRGGYD